MFLIPSSYILENLGCYLNNPVISTAQSVAMVTFIFIFLMRQITFDFSLPYEMFNTYNTSI